MLAFAFAFDVCDLMLPLLFSLHFIPLPPIDYTLIVYALLSPYLSSSQLTYNSIMKAGRCIVELRHVEVDKPPL
jgi:hypothetical protein